MSSNRALKSYSRVAHLILVLFAVPAWAALAGSQCTEEYALRESTCKVMGAESQLCKEMTSAVAERCQHLQQRGGAIQASPSSRSSPGVSAPSRKLPYGTPDLECIYRCSMHRDASRWLLICVLFFLRLVGQTLSLL